jgi:autotransporter-associated beta strand protein
MEYCRARGDILTVRRGSVRAVLLASTALIGAAALPAAAQDATWNLNGTGDFNTAANWTPATVPTGTAFFGTSAQTNVSVAAFTTIGGWTFNAGASNYTFTIGGLNVLSFNGAGIVINGGSATINNNNAFLAFDNGSTAGSAGITNNGAINVGNGSTAGSATITNNGTINVFNGSTAGSATITNNGTINVFNGSTAGSASITNNATLQFLDTSTAGSAGITNSSTLQFLDTSTAGSATITNSPGGIVQFFNGSTAGNASINAGNNLTFSDTSTAGSASITTSGGGALLFFDSSTAGSATITNNSGAIVQFFNGSTAGTATITNNHLLTFVDTSTGGTARFINGAGGTIDLSLLTSAGITAGSIEDGGTISLGSKNLQVGGNNLSTIFSGVLQDGGVGGGVGGSLTKTGSGTLTLTGVNTYTGGTTINAGTLAVSADNNLGGAGGGLAFGGGALQFLSGFTSNRTVALNAGGGTFDTNGNTATLGGTISGPGGLTKIGIGTLTLTGSSSYAGATSINGGTLAGGAANAFSAASATTVNTGGALDLGGFAQTINTINLAGGTIQNGTLTGAIGSTGGTISGIGGTAAVTTTSGTTTVLGSNGYTGATTVNGSTLIVNGSIANSALTVNPGGTLGGSGIVDNTTINGGTLAPGNSIGTLTVQGNLVLTAAAAYIVEVSPSQADRTNVTGTATLGGTVQAVFGAGGVAQRYTILHADGGLGGTTFGGLTTTNLSNFNASLSYSATDVFLNLTAALGAGTPLNQNQQNVAGAINGFFNNGGTLPPNFISTFGLTGGNLANALTLLSGEAATGAQRGVFQLGGQFLSLMLDPFVDGRSGIGGAGGPALGFAPERAALPEEIALAYAKVTKAPVYKAAPVGFEQRWSVWGGAYGGYNKTDGDPAVVGSHDLTARTAGFAAGMDYRVAPGTVLGFALAGGGTKWDLAQGLGGGRSDAFQAGVYAATRSGPAYLAAALAFSNHWMSTDRFAALGDHLTANFNAQSVGGRVEGGWRFGGPVFGVTPYAAVQAQSFRIPTYSEADLTNGGFGLTYNSRTATDTRSELGARFDHVALVDAGSVLTLRGRLAWAHDWVSDPSLAAAFQALPGAGFIVNGATPAKNSALASAGAELRFANGVSLLAKFDGEFASHAQTYAGTGTLRVNW